MTQCCWILDFKSEGTLPLSDFPGSDSDVKVGDKFIVSVKGRDADGYYLLSRQRIAQPKDWTSLEQAFAGKSTIVGTVTSVVKGGLSVDVGVRAFMPASRSGVRDAAEMEKLVGQEIQCRITKLDVGDEDVVVDRRVVMEDEAKSLKESRYATIREGDLVRGTVRSLADYGAFVDLGGFDGLLHVSDMAWSRVGKPEDVLSVGQEIEAKVLKMDADRQRISLGLKQLQRSSVGCGRGEIQDWRSRPRPGHASRGFWSIRRVRTWSRRLDPYLRNVLDQEAENSGRLGEAR